MSREIGTHSRGGAGASIEQLAGQARILGSVPTRCTQLLGLVDDGTFPDHAIGLAGARVEVRFFGDGDLAGHDDGKDVLDDGEKRLHSIQVLVEAWIVLSSSWVSLNCGNAMEAAHARRLTLG